jgi:hypothetical protein
MPTNRDWIPEAEPDQALPALVSAKVWVDGKGRVRIQKEIVYEFEAMFEAASSGEKSK